MNEAVKPVARVMGEVIGDHAESKISVCCPEPIRERERAEFEGAPWVDIMEDGTVGIPGSFKAQLVFGLRVNLER